MTPAIHKPLCDLLQDQTQSRVKIVLPRGWLKTTVCTIAYPIWRAIRDPNVRVLIVQNTYDNAALKLRSIRAVFEENGLFRALFPELLPSKDSVWKSNSLCVSRDRALSEGTFDIAGIRTQVVSRHYDLIVEDDTVAPALDDLGEENIAPTKDDIDQAIGWHRLATPLLVDIDKSQILVVGTRWFEKDLLSWITEREKSYVSYERACKETDGKPDPDGIIVYPERFSQHVLDLILASMGPYMYSCLYMNDPMRSQDMVFQLEWFKYYETAPGSLIIYTSVDLAGDPTKQKGKDGDYNVIITAGKDIYTGNVFVLDYWRKRCNPGEVADALFAVYDRWKPVKVLIEGVAYQNTFQYWLKEQMKQKNIWIPFENIIHGTTSKNQRIQGLQPLVFSGQLKFKPHMTSLTGELTAFPLGKHDDIADALSMQLAVWRRTKKKEPEKTVADHLSLDTAIEEFRDKLKSDTRNPLAAIEAHHSLSGYNSWEQN